MKRLPKQAFTLEFKQAAIRQVEVDKRRPAEVARELGVIEQFSKSGADFQHVDYFCLVTADRLKPTIYHLAVAGRLDGSRWEDAILRFTRVNSGWHCME